MKLVLILKGNQTIYQKYFFWLKKGFHFRTSNEAKSCIWFQQTKTKNQDKANQNSDWNRFPLKFDVHFEAFEYYSWT